MSWISRMREKPQSTRVHIALLIAMIFTALIAMVWVLSLSQRFSESKAHGETINDTPHVLQEFIDATKDQIEITNTDTIESTSTPIGPSPRRAQEESLSTQENTPPREVLVGTTTSSQ